MADTLKDQPKLLANIVVDLTAATASTSLEDYAMALNGLLLAHDCLLVDTIPVRLKESPKP